MQSVIITGASAGIGAALAAHYAREGATLGLIARRRAELEKLAAGLSCHAALYAVDVRDSTAMQVAAADFIERHGAPDIVIANAGLSAGTVTEYAEDLQAFADILDINVLGIVKTFQPFIAAMRVAHKGKLVGIASVAGYRGIPGGGAYSASKAAAIAYLESLRIELKGTGIEVITICPGYVATELTARNPYPMPFILSAAEAAQKIARVIERSKAFSVIPWQMAIVARVLHVLPRWAFDRIFQGAPRKPRRIRP